MNVADRTGQLSLVPAPLVTRLAAFLMDCAVGFGLAVLFAVATWIVLLLTSQAGEIQPSDPAIYLALSFSTAWLPVWGAWTLLSWVRGGRSLGQAAMALRVTDLSGTPVGPFRALARLLILAVATGLLVVAAILAIGSIAALAQGTLPRLVGLAAIATLVLALVDPACCILSKRRRALHDLAAGTLVSRG